MSVTPIRGTPALEIKTARERVLVVADLHLGIEKGFAKKGISFPSQIPRIGERLIKLVERKKSDRLILLGDVKHNIPIVGQRERRELLRFFETLAKSVRVEVVRGNHDGHLINTVPEYVIIHSAKGIVIGKRKRVGLMHGHTWPPSELLDTEMLVVAHNHPVIETHDESGRIVKQVWLRAKLDRSKFPEKFRTRIGERLPELLIMPAFNELVGVAVNRITPKGFLGPIFKAGIVQPSKAEVYSLDGTFLGEVGILTQV